MPKLINLSASRGAAILGLSKWSTPVQVWLEIMESRQPGFCEKNKFLLPEFEYNSAMKWGHAFESAIIELAEGKSDNKIIEREMLTTAPIVPAEITCHQDGRYQYTNILHEGKTTSQFYFKDNFGESGTDQVPVEYQIQCQHQMICTGAEKVILSVLVFPKRVEEWEELGIEIKENNGKFYLVDWNKNPVDTINPLKWAKILSEMGFFHQYKINANAELQQQMINAYTEFWNENVLKEMPPEPKSYDNIKALVREPVGTIVADENMEYLMSEYKQIKSEIGGTGSLAKRAEDIKVEILNKMKESEHVLDDDSKDKYVLRDRAGKKIASYGKNKNGVFIFK